MRNALISAALFLAACAHAPAAAPVLPAPAAPCVTTAPPDPTKHQLKFAGEPERGQMVDSEENRTNVLKIIATLDSVTDFFGSVQELLTWSKLTWSKAAWAKCSK